MRFVIFLAFCTATVPGAAQESFRLAAIDASKAPRVFAVVDPSPSNKRLEAGEFALRIDGKSSGKATATPEFRDTDQGVALIVALDASGSMRGRPMDAIRQGLAGLVTRKREQDRVAVLSFADDFRWEYRWDANTDSLEDTFRNLVSRGNQTRLYDAVGIALDEFTTQKDLPARRSLLIISDGHDEGSNMRLADLSNRLRESRVRLDAAGLANSPRWFPVLRQLAQAGFGEFQAASGPESLERSLEQGLDRLLEMRVLEFDAEDLSKDGTVHRLAVEHTATSWRDEVRVTAPQEPWWLRTPVLIGVGLLLLSTTGAVIFMLTRSRQGAKELSRPRPPASVNTPVRVTREQSGPLLQTVQHSRPVAHQPPTEYEMIASSRPTPPASTPSPRQETVLAPTSSGGYATPAALRMIAGPYAGQRMALTETVFWIGSRPGNHLCLSADTGISGNHMYIRREGSMFHLYDHGSLNGTWVNGQQIGPEGVLLRAGDRVKIGASEFALEL